MGYHLAWPDAEIVGVDIDPQPNYPFQFVQADAMTFDLTGFDFVHASPPCQAHTTMSNRYRGRGGAADSHADLIAGIRWRLTMHGAPYIIENVPGARREMVAPITLTGGMFGLGVERPRLFDCSFPVTVPARRKTVNPVGVYGRHHDGRRLFTRKDGTSQHAAASLEEGRQAMGGIDWMGWRELAESIPPAYTRYLAEQYSAIVERAA